MIEIQKTYSSSVTSLVCASLAQNSVTFHIFPTTKQLRFNAIVSKKKSAVTKDHWMFHGNYKSKILGYIHHGSGYHTGNEDNHACQEG